MAKKNSHVQFGTQRSKGAERRRLEKEIFKGKKEYRENKRSYSSFEKSKPCDFDCENCDRKCSFR